MNNLVTPDIELLETQLSKVIDEIDKAKKEDQDVQGLINQCQVSYEYQDQVNYFKEFWRFYIYNELAIKKINELQEQNTKLVEMENNIEVLLQDIQIAIQQKLKKKNRRTSQEIEKSFTCPYDKCTKVYGSDVSLNLHIKLKHEGGNKTDREKIAVICYLNPINKKLIIQAQDRGEDVPKNLEIKFPPGYLDQYRRKFKQENGITRKINPKRSCKNKVPLYS